MFSIKGYLQKTVTLATFSPTASMLLSNVRCGLLKSAVSEELFCKNCRQLQLLASNIRRRFSTFNLGMPAVHLIGKMQTCHPLTKCVRLKHITESGPTHHKNRWQDKGQHFVESENEFFHSYLESSFVYQPYLLSFQQKKELNVLPKETVATLLKEAKEDKKIEDVLRLFDHWACVARMSEGWHVLSDDSFSQTTRLLKKCMNHMSVEDAIECMVNLSGLGFRQSMLSHSEPRRNRILLSKVFDQLCSKRLKKLDVRQLLLAADFFYCVRGSSFTDFPFLMCERMKFFLPELTKPELILLLFHAGLTRTASSNLISASLEHLKDEMASLTIQELGIVNLAHYKTRAHVTQPAYFSALTKQLETDASLNVDPICLSAVLKYQQKSLNKSKNQFLPQFFTTVRTLEDPLLTRISSLPSETLMHVLNLYYSLDLLSEDLFTATIDRIRNKGLKDWRVKDLAKVTHVLTNIPLGSERKMEALAAILVEMRKTTRQAERQAHPECMLQIAVALTYCSVYPHWLVQEIFSDMSQRRFKDSDIDFRRDLYHLSESIIIEDGTYVGPLLWADNFPKLSKNKIYSKLLQTPEGRKMCGAFVKHAGRKKMSTKDFFTRDWMLLEVMKALIKARPEAVPLPTFILSHFQTPDVEVKVVSQDQANGEPALNPACLDSLDFVSEAVVLHASNAYQNVRCRDGKTVPLLRQYHAMRVRQLRKLGAIAVEVPYFELKDSGDKGQYLLTKFQQEEERLLGIGLD